MTLIYRDGALYFNTYRKSTKARNLTRDPRVAVVVATSDDADPFTAFEARGRARVFEPEETPPGLLDLGGGEGGSSGVISEADLARVRARLASGQRAYVQVEVEEWTACEPLAPLPDAPTASDRALAWAGAVQPGRIAMTPDEVAAFLGAKQVAVVGSIAADGRPRGRPLHFRWNAGMMQLAVPEGSPLPADLGADPRACATVEEFPTYDSIRGVLLQGQVDRIAQGSAASLAPGRIISFDFTKIGSASRG